MPLAKEQKSQIIKDYQLDKKDSGSPEVQIAILTNRINGLSDHFKANNKDHHSRRGLIRMVSRRRKLLDYVRGEDESRYQDLLKRLNIRK